VSVSVDIPIATWIIRVIAHIPLLAFGRTGNGA
jgi:hypothetical protein